MYMGAASDLMWLLLAEDKNDFDDPQGWGDMVLEMMIAYNLVECLPNVLVNIALMMKEFSMPIWQLIINRRAPSDDDRIQISLIDLEDLFTKWLNPYFYFRKGYQKVEGYDPTDMVIENKNDEEHYYARDLFKNFKH